jgi:transposase-like protein
MLEPDKGIFCSMERENSSELLKSTQTCSETLTLRLSQDRAITALLQCRSVAAAARQAKVGQSTLRRWLREDQDFQTALRCLREQALTHAAMRLQESASVAVDTLYGLLASKDRIEPGRASLIRTAIDFAFRSGAHSDLVERIAALENAPRPKSTDTFLPEGNQIGQGNGSAKDAGSWCKETEPPKRNGSNGSHSIKAP